jgi:hypothetical protein
MTDDTENKRRIGRIRTILAGQAIIGRGLPDVPCQIKDLSDTGARITVEEGAFLPEQFELRIPKRGTVNPVRLRWRRGGLAGLEFVPDERPAATDPVLRIKELEAENAELRRRVAEMAERLYAYGDSERLSI